MKHTLLISATGVCCLMAIAVLTNRGMRSERALLAEMGRVNRVKSTVERLERFDTERPLTLGVKEPETGLSALVSDSLIRSGLPVSTMASLNPDQQTTQGSTLQRRSFRISLQPLRLPELGRFLSDWRNHHPQWRAISMQCTPLALDPKLTIDRTHAVPAPLSVLVIFENVFVPSKVQVSNSSLEYSSKSIPPNSAPLLR